VIDVSTIPVLIDRALRAAGIPIDGVSIGSESDRATWSVSFAASANAQQRAQAQGLLLTIPIDIAAQTLGDQQDAQIDIDALGRVENAIVLTIIDQLNVLRGACRALGASGLPDITPAQARAAIRAKAGIL
jgi:hypothetical protein